MIFLKILYSIKYQKRSKNGYFNVKINEKGLKKFDLRKAGFNPNIIDKILSGNLNKQRRVDTETINRLCEYLDCQPGDIMEYKEDHENGWKQKDK